MPEKMISRAEICHKYGIRSNSSVINWVDYEKIPFPKGVWSSEGGMWMYSEAKVQEWWDKRFGNKRSR